MKYIIVIVLLSLSVLNAQFRPGLFGRVVHIPKNDTLNIRQKPDYKSNQVGSLPNDAYIGIEKCQRIRQSSWCQIYQITQNVYEKYHPGWVNARYIKFSNKGYVNIKGRINNCYYSVKCIDDHCLVVLDTTYDSDAQMLSSIKTEWLKKDRLTGESNFGAMNKEEDGFCNVGNIIQDYFLKN